MTRFLLLLLLLVALSPSPAGADALIVPGMRINGAYMQQPESLVVRGWGQPDEKESRGEELTLYRNKRHSTIFYIKEGSLVGVETFSDRFKTESGVKVGISRQEVVSAFGAPIDQENYSFTCLDGVTRDFYSFVYKGEGIGFSFNPETHKVVSIFVFPVGKFSQVRHQQ
jgi:hypothetical protein